MAKKKIRHNRYDPREFLKWMSNRRNNTTAHHPQVRKQIIDGQEQMKLL